MPIGRSRKGTVQINYRKGNPFIPLTKYQQEVINGEILGYVLCISGEVPYHASAVFFQRVNDWRGLRKHHPVLYAIAEEWERQAIDMTEKGYTWRRGYNLESMRKMDESQLVFWPEPDEEPCLLCNI